MCSQRNATTLPLARLTLAARSLTTDRLDGQDTTSFAYGASARIPLSAAPTEPDAHSTGTGRLEPQVGASTASGSNTQDLAAGHSLDIGDIFVLGPESVATDFEERGTSVGLAVPLSIDESFTITPRLDLLPVERELEVDTLTLSASDDTRALGLDLGGELGWRAPNTPIRVYASVREALPVDEGINLERRAIELGPGWEFDEHTPLLVGWRHRKWNEDADFGDSDIE